MIRTSARRRVAVLLAAASLLAGGLTAAVAGPADARPATCCTKG
jgi:hypothetical protein